MFVSMIAFFDQGQYHLFLSSGSDWHINTNVYDIKKRILNKIRSVFLGIFTLINSSCEN